MKYKKGDTVQVVGKNYDPEFVKYIEVKSTKRVTSPDINNNDWKDTVNVTRNEWIAAEQHNKSYEIYRVYFTTSGPILFIIKNPYDKNEKGLLRTIPTTYRLDFSRHSIDEVVKIGTKI